MCIETNRTAPSPPPPNTPSRLGVVALFVKTMHELHRYFFTVDGEVCHRLSLSELVWVLRLEFGQGSEVTVFVYVLSVGVSKPVSSVHIAPRLLRPEDVCPRVCYCHGQTAQHLIILHFFSAYPTVLDSLEWKRAPVTVGYICVVVKLHVCIYIYIYICVCVCVYQLKHMHFCTHT